MIESKKQQCTGDFEAAETLLTRATGALGDLWSKNVAMEPDRIMKIRRYLLKAKSKIDMANHYLDMQDDVIKKFAEIKV